MGVTRSYSPFLNPARIKRACMTRAWHLYMAAHTIKVLGRSLASFQALLWYGRFCLLHTCALRAGTPNLVQLGDFAGYTYMYGLMGQCYTLLPYPARSYALLFGLQCLWYVWEWWNKMNTATPWSIGSDSLKWRGRPGGGAIKLALMWGKTL